MARNKQHLVRSKPPVSGQNKGTTVDQDNQTSDSSNQENTTNEQSSAPTVVDQGIQNNEIPSPPAPALAPGVVPALAPGMEPEPALAPGVVPTLAPGVAPALAPGVEPQLAPGVQPTLAPGVAPTADSKSAKVVDTSAPKASDFEQTMSKIKADGTKAEKDLINNLEHYIAKMKPGLPMDFEKGAQNQHHLWKTISGLAERAPTEEFRKLWSILLSYFHQYRNDVFHQRYVFRFAEYWRHSDNELNALQRIINVIQLTADPADRRNGLRQVSLERSLAEGFSEEAKQRIASYYN